MTKAMTTIKSDNEQLFFDHLKMVGERVELVKTLTYDVVQLEGERGRNALALGRKLKQIREILSGEGSRVAWVNWCETFVHSENYATRMIQVADLFHEDMPGVLQLSLQHMREIARYSDNQEDLTRLTEIASSAQIPAKQLRFLVSETKKGKLDLDQLIAEHADIKTELDRRMKAAAKEGQQTSKDEIDQLKASFEEVTQQNVELCEELAKKNKRIDDLAMKIKTKEAEVKLGSGDPELGKLKIKLEQSVQERDNLQLTLDDVQKSLRKVQVDYEKLANGPVGQAKLDIRKTVDEIVYFFKDKMVPVQIALKVKKLPEARAEILAAAEAVEKWAKQVVEELDN